MIKVGFPCLHNYEDRTVQLRCGIHEETMTGIVSERYCTKCLVVAAEDLSTTPCAECEAITLRAAVLRAIPELLMLVAIKGDK